MANTTVYNSMAINFSANAKTSQIEAHRFSYLAEGNRISRCAKSFYPPRSSQSQNVFSLVKTSDSNRHITGLHTFCNTEAQVGTLCSRSRLSRICRL